MVERFVEFAGLISIGTGASTVVGSGTAFGGVDREGCQVWVQPAGVACFRIGTVAAVGVALTGLRRRPLGNSLIIGGVAVAAVGSALAGLGGGGGSFFTAAAALLLYAGFVSRR